MHDIHWVSEVRALISMAVLMSRNRRTSGRFNLRGSCSGLYSTTFLSLADISQAVVQVCFALRWWSCSVSALRTLTTHAGRIALGATEI
jgi:hypothetical protein